MPTPDPEAPPPAPPSTRDADVSHAARNGVVQVLTILAQAVMATTQVVFARLYGRTIYGAYQTLLAILEVTSRAGAAGADKAMLRYVAAFRASGDPAGVRSAIGTGLRLCLGLASLLGLGLVLFAHPLAVALKKEWLAPALRIVAPLPIFAGCLWILIQASLAARVTRANFFVRGLFEPSMLLAAGVTAWALGGGLRGLAAAQVTAAAVTLLVAVLVVRRVLRPGELRGVLRAPRLRGFARFSLPMSLAELLNAVLQRADILIVTAYRGLEAAAVYAAAEFLTRSIANIRYAFDSIVAGVISETLHLRQHDRLQYNLRLTTRWVISVAAPVAATVIVLRAELLGGLYGSVYVDGAAALVVLAFNHLASASFGLMGWVLTASGRSGLILLNNVLGVAVNITAGLLLTARFGLVGAGFAALGSTLVAQAAALIEIAAVERVHPFSAALLKPVAAALVAFVVQRALHAAVGPAGLRVAAVIVGGVLAYALGLTLLGLPPEERAMAARALGAIGKGGRSRKPDRAK